MKAWFAASACLLTACSTVIEADTLIVNGTVFSGAAEEAVQTSVAIKGDKIVHIGSADRVRANSIIDADGLYVMPGFIDPHTHSLSDLLSDDAVRRRNDNYLFQGVTTVVNGNDGFGEPDIADQFSKLDAIGIGSNTALFLGHGALRQSVMGGDDREPTDKELTQMSEIVSDAVAAGGLGLSTGLFYAPGSFADTSEVVVLARAAAARGGIYDSHIRDESNYSVGLMDAIEEVIQIAEEADIPANIAHIKALGTDVWGQSEAVIARVEQAQAAGLKITADQYPWRASGTRISNALLPRWVKAGSPGDYQARLADPSLSDQIQAETQENLRRRGGAESILITAALTSDGRANWTGKTLGEIAEAERSDPVSMAIEIAKRGDARIASFNMNPDDMRRFMSQPWVMTSSDGSTGHPRKYGSYSKKFRDYVIDKKWISTTDFVHRSTGLVAQTFGLCGRGYIKPNYYADIAIIDPERFAPRADFKNPERLSEGVSFLFVNGVAVIEEGLSTDALPGRAVKRCDFAEN